MIPALDQRLCTIGFNRPASDGGIYGNGKTNIFIYVDDILVGCDSLQDLESVRIGK